MPDTSFKEQQWFKPLNCHDKANKCHSESLWLDKRLCVYRTGESLWTTSQRGCLVVYGESLALKFLNWFRVFRGVGLICQAIIIDYEVLATFRWIIDLLSFYITDIWASFCNCNDCQLLLFSQSFPSSMFPFPLCAPSVGIFAVHGKYIPRELSSKQ